VQRVKSGQGVVVDAHIFVQKLATTDVEDVSVADDCSRTHRLAVEKRWVDLAHLHGNHLPRWQHAARSTQHTAHNTQHAARSTQHAARSTQHACARVSEDKERSCKGGLPQHAHRPTTNHKTDHPFRLLNAKKKHSRQKTNLAAAIVLDDKVNVGHANLLDANVALVERPGAGEVRQGKARRNGGDRGSAVRQQERDVSKIGVAKIFKKACVRPTLWCGGREAVERGVVHTLSWIPPKRDVKEEHGGQQSTQPASMVT
jgi:hypothetical protein